MTRLTPYDTGEVLEPKLHVTPGNAASLDPDVNPHAAELRSRYGKVDFDNESAETVAIVHIVRNDDSGATAPYTIRITGNPDDFDIEWED